MTQIVGFRNAKNGIKIIKKIIFCSQIGWYTSVSFLSQIAGKAVIGPLIDYTAGKGMLTLTTATKIAQCFGTFHCNSCETHLLTMKCEGFNNFQRLRKKKFKKIKIKKILFKARSAQPFLSCSCPRCHHAITPTSPATSSSRMVSTEIHCSALHYCH